MTEGISRVANAKINVFLRVIGRRDDGDHDVETVMLPVDLNDSLRVRPAPTLSLTVEGPYGQSIVGADRNLVLEAARRLAASAGREPHAAITLVKRIPVAAGMGGGSADAAAALLALNDLWGCGLDDAALADVAAAVGADVPGLLAGGAVFADGRGDHVVPVHASTTWWAVKPLPIAVRAADAYGWWDEQPRTGPDPGALLAALETGNVELLGSALFNDLQGPVVHRHPAIAGALSAFVDAGALGAIMTGSGPTVVALARHAGHAAALTQAVTDSFVVSGPVLAR